MIRTVLVLLWFIVFFASTLPVLLVFYIIRMFSPEKCELYSQNTVRILVKGLLFLSGVKVTVKGRENVPPNETLLYVPNHRSYFDFLLAYDNVSGPVTFVGKQELKKVPVMGQWIVAMGTLLLNRGSVKEGLKVINEACDKIKSGTNVFIFPEGTRNKGIQEEPLPFKDGSLKISSWTGCRVIPVAIINSRSIYEEHRPYIRRTPVTVIFGEPVDPESLSKEDRKAYGAYIRAKIINMILQEEETGKETEDV